MAGSRVDEAKKHRRGSEPGNDQAENSQGGTFSACRLWGAGGGVTRLYGGVSPVLAGNLSDDLRSRRRAGRAPGVNYRGRNPATVADLMAIGLAPSANSV